MVLASHNVPAPPGGKYPAKAHARKVAAFVREKHAGLGVEKGVIYLEGQKSKQVEVCFVSSIFIPREMSTNGLPLV
jgi:hypothetical protein